MADRLHFDASPSRRCMTSPCDVLGSPSDEMMTFWPSNGETFGIKARFLAAPAPIKAMSTRFFDLKIIGLKEVHLFLIYFHRVLTP